MAKKPELTAEEQLHAEQVAAGWFTSEWGEWRAPVEEVSNEVEKPYLEGKE